MNAKYKAAHAFGELTLESFRLNGRLLATGDELARDLQMTSASWQVLGTLVLAGEPVTVAEIARRMGLARQSVQRITDRLAESKLVEHGEPQAAFVDVHSSALLSNPSTTDPWSRRRVVLDHVHALH